MELQRLVRWSTVVLFALTVGASAQEPSSQKLFESGNYDAVLERAGSGSPEDIYLAAMAHLKAGNNDGAAGELRKLGEHGDEAWKQVGASGVAMLEHNDGDAVAAGRRATEVAGDNAYAHYQLGMAAAAAADFGTAADAFDRATQLKPDFAYAHYYAGQAFQKQRNIQKASEHYQYFLQLAPDSPDRAAIQALMRTLRG